MSLRLAERFFVRKLHGLGGNYSPRFLFMPDVDRGRIPGGEAVFTGLLFFAKMKQSKFGLLFYSEISVVKPLFEAYLFAEKGRQKAKKRFPIKDRETLFKQIETGREIVLDFPFGLSRGLTGEGSNGF